MSPIKTAEENKIIINMVTKKIKKMMTKIVTNMIIKMMIKMIKQYGQIKNQRETNWIKKIF